MTNALEKLFKEGRLKKEPGIKNDQIKRRIDRASIDLLSAEKLFDIDEIGAFRMAYDSMLQSGIALILFHGYRPQVQYFHKTVVEAVGLVLGGEFSVIVKQFDIMRRSRNDLIYDISPIAKNEAKEALIAAQKMIDTIKQLIKLHSKQKELI
jgi:uncharacterized protein (UPF0332 family)